MKYSKELQQSLDIDWFAVDNNGIIIHFASGGGAIPLSVSSFLEDTGKISRYFRSLPYINDQISVNDRLSKIVTFASEQNRQQYLSDFLSMAKRGFYSFDKSNLGDFSNKDYHLVAYPDNILRIEDLPNDIKNILGKTKINIDIKNSSSDLSISEAFT